MGVKLAESQGRSLKSQSSFRFLARPRGRDEDLVVRKKVDAEKTVQIQPGYSLPHKPGSFDPVKILTSARVI